MITTADRRANASLVREFYAEASQTKESFVKVRGKVVDYSPARINRVLGRAAPHACEFGSFFAKMTQSDEELILKEIAVDGKTWDRDGQRRCLHASALTTEAAIWFQFLRASVAPTSHDTTLSMHKCAMLYSILTGKKINLGIIMHGAIHQARKRNKVILPLPCLITSLLIDAGVPTAAEDQWLVSTRNISIQTVKKMGREIGEQETEPPSDEPNVCVAEEHTVGNVVPTVRRKNTPLRQSAASKAGTSRADPITAVLQAITSLTYKVDMLAAQQKHANRALEAVWAYTRDRNLIVDQIHMASDPVLAAQIPDFPEGICPNTEGGDDWDDDGDEEEESSDGTPKATPTP